MGRKKGAQCYLAQRGLGLEPQRPEELRLVVTFRPKPWL